MRHFLKKVKKRFLSAVRLLHRNDVVLKIYASFAIVLVLMGVLTGFIFLNIYRENYLSSYTELLTDKGKIISKRVARFEERDKETKFANYNTYVSQLERVENTDIWVVANKNAKEPLRESFVNAVADDITVSGGTLNILEQTFEKGKVFHTSEYDSVYGMVTLSVTVPVVNRATKEISGAVLLVSMIDMQTMGIKEGRYIISLSVFIAILVAFVVSLLFSRYLSRTISKLSHHIGVLAKGDYHPVKIKRPHSQIGHLERSLENLSGKLRKAEEERAELEQVRRDFFANVSHELRTPITVLRGYTETLSDGVIEEKEKVEELYGRMLSECQGMERLVGDLFILSKMQNPDFQIEKEPVSLKQIFEDILRSVDELGKSKKIQWNFMIPDDDLCLILGDYGRLRQMFLVILDNAIKFSDENGKIDIRVEKNGKKFDVCIRDYGTGIKKEELPYIFEKFYTSKMRQNTKGTGLGLMIAKQIAVRHGSDIMVESREGEGSAFCFSFDECESTEGYE